MTPKNTNCILILFGSNAVSYNIAAAFFDTSYKTLSLLPADTSKINKFSKKFSKIEISKYDSMSSQYLKELIEFLNRQSLNKKILTFLTNDISIEFWIKYQAELSKYCTIGIENIEYFYRKDYFYNALKNIGISYPATWKTHDEIPTELGKIIVKPAYKNSSNKFWNLFHSKIIITKSTNNFDWTRKFSSGELLFQEKLNFDLGDEFSWWGYRSENGIVFSVCAQHVNKYPDKSGRISHAKLLINKEVLNIGNSIVEQLDYVGIADIQMIYDRSKRKYKVVEMNPRLWCSHELLLLNDINFIEHYANDYYNQQFVKNFRPTFLREYKKEWYSILFNIDQPLLNKPNCTEYFNLKQETWAYKILIWMFLMAKYSYYRLNRKILYT